MSLSINSSTSSAALSGLSVAQKKQHDALTALISGSRINKAADDSSGLSISTQLTAQIRGLTTASASGQNAVSLLQTADGGLEQTTAQLQRVRDLTVQAAGTTDPGALSAIGQEITQNLAEVDRISQSTSWGSQSLLDGSLSSGTKFQLGTSGSASDEVNVSIGNAASSALGLSGLAAAVTSGGAGGALAGIDDAIKAVTDTRSDIGAAQNSLTSAVSNIGNQILNTTQSNSRIADADFAESIMNSTLAGLQSQASTAMLAQSNDLSKSILQLLQ